MIQKKRKEKKRNKKKRRRKKNLRDPGPAVVGGLTLGRPNMILAKGSNPEMNVSKGLNHSHKDHGWGAVSLFLGTPEDFWELNSQFLRFREMVKLTRIGGTHQLKLLVYVETTLRQNGELL